MSKYTEDLDKAIEDLDDDIYARGVARDTNNPKAFKDKNERFAEAMNDINHPFWNKKHGESHD